MIFVCLFFFFNTHTSYNNNVRDGTFYQVIRLTNETPEALNLFKSGGVLKSHSAPCRRSEVARDVISRARIIKGVKIVENDIYFLSGPIPSSVVFYPPRRCTFLRP